MGKQRTRKNDDNFVLFDVVYEDGTRSSRRKIPATDVGGLDGDKAVGALIEAQDRKIAELSGVARGRIKSFARSPGQ
jgi:hypothetical protein